ncbi:hypothetical protein NQU49_26805, partial [Escherichia coli]|uniref:hypothetical protein n=1 Tax=Escherichia coli TaxID=562 RepID=UPI00211903DB
PVSSARRVVAFYGIFIFPVSASSRNPTPIRGPMHGPERTGIGATSMAIFLMLLGAAGIAVLIAYVTFCDRI